MDTALSTPPVHAIAPELGSPGSGQVSREGRLVASCPFHPHAYVKLHMALQCWGVVTRHDENTGRILFMMLNAEKQCFSVRRF